MRRLGVVGLQKPWLTKKQALTVQAGVPAKGQLIEGLVEGRLGDKLGLSREYPNPTRNPEPEPERRILLASTDTTDRRFSSAEFHETLPSCHHPSPPTFLLYRRHSLYCLVEEIGRREFPVKRQP